MKIRTATILDLERILEIYAYARTFMAQTGNPTQWGDGYPKKELLTKDIEQGQLYVMEEKNEIHGVFVFIIGADPTYEVIKDGAWPDNSPYGTIHRIAGDGQVKGLLQLCVAFCKTQIKILRIDTHHDNRIMQRAIEKNGFQRCGIIYTANGSPRIAYQSNKE
ncbi:N-acetyltransferase [Emergencia timonensis]|uniref:N-acetyltransferase n=1 Tax=Emergencia timonensis TaxID=1776384 RepID=UPI0039913577